MKRIKMQETGYKRKKRQIRIRKKVKGTTNRPRLSVFRSNKHIYAQIIDDKKGKTLVSASELEKFFLDLAKDLKKISEDEKKKIEENIKSLSKKERSRLVGKIIAQKALKEGIKRVSFDRGGYKYHGRIKDLAEGAREGGLNF